MRITLFKGAEDTPVYASILTATPNEFFDQIEKGTPQKTHNNAEKLKGEGFVLGQYKEGATSKHLTNLTPESVTEIFCYDVDDMSWEQIAEGLEIWQKHDCLLYSTFKHTAENPRLRVLFALDKPVPAVSFVGAYLAVAAQLKIKPDPNTCDPTRLSFLPQFNPSKCSDPVMARFRGVPVSVPLSTPSKQFFKDTLDLPPPVKPSKTELKRLAGKWLKTKPSVGAALENILAGEGYAPDGERHQMGLKINMALAQALGRVDGEWFADKYLKSIWEGWGVDLLRSFKDWTDSADSAAEKWARQKALMEEERREIQAERVAPLNDVELQKVKDAKGRIVVSYRGDYYAYDPKANRYVGPFKAGELPTACREYLGGVKGLQVVKYANDRPSLKTAPEILFDYGKTVSELTFHAYEPAEPYDAERNAIRTRAYHWNVFRPTFHMVADDLLRAVFGRQYPKALKYLSAFRNLKQPLPALTLVGPRGVWKSQICSILSRFWGARTYPTVCDASLVMGNFADPLLQNPVILSDEQLATENGKRIPEKYRAQITAKHQQINQKGIKPVILESAVRHMVAVNDIEKVFSTEVELSCIEATMERFFVVDIDSEKVAEFEDHWRGSQEMTALREGTPLLEHVMWIESNCKEEPEGRLFISTETSESHLLKARFANDTLYYCIVMALETVEVALRSPGLKAGLFLDADGVLRMAPQRIFDQWTESKTGQAAKTIPSVQRIGQFLTKADFKLDPKERASKSRYGGWKVKTETLAAFLENSDLEPLDSIMQKLEKIKHDANSLNK